MLFRPEADLPVVQLSLLSSMDPKVLPPPGPAVVLEHARVRSQQVVQFQIRERPHSDSAVCRRILPWGGLWPRCVTREC